jgi:hypothetical protein
VDQKFEAKKGGSETALQKKRGELTWTVMAGACACKAPMLSSVSKSRYASEASGQGERHVGRRRKKKK